MGAVAKKPLTKEDLDNMSAAELSKVTRDDLSAMSLVEISKALGFKNWLRLSFLPHLGIWLCIGIPCYGLWCFGLRSLSEFVMMIATIFLFPEFILYPMGALLYPPYWVIKGITWLLKRAHAKFVQLRRV